MSTRKIEWTRTTLIVGVFSLLAVGSWIGFDLYRSLVKTTLPNVLQSQLLPLETRVDSETISNLRGRTGFDQSALDQVQSIPAEVPTGTPAPLSRSLTPSIAPTPEATGSGVATASAQIQL